ncbi:hypothetical protein [Nocardia neocaledoniensis]|uniref:hypothetical protein n=1 Tax=Nocardia neocaledoniensis TaxID=236511 RepID=UPI0024587332|nr:hypothetical protein [Nocardia neocaledoniensis]
MNPPPPARVRRGEPERSPTAASGARRARGLPGATGVHTIAGAGHGCALTHPEQVAAALLELVAAGTPELAAPVAVAGI